MRLFSGNTELLNRCLWDTLDNLRETDEPFPLGLVIDTRSSLGAHLAIDMEIAGETPRSYFETAAVINKLEATGEYQAALEKAAAIVLGNNEAKAKMGDIPIALGVADRLAWEATLRNYAVEVDDYYHQHIEEIVSLFNQCLATLTAGRCPVAIIEPKPNRLPGDEDERLRHQPVVPFRKIAYSTRRPNSMSRQITRFPG